MTIEHKDIPDSDRHEPKGVSIAAVNTVYKANGSGSGTWAKVGSADIQGLSGDSGETNKVLVSDGSNGFIFRKDIVYGSMTITSNSTNFPLTAVADTTFNTASQFTLFTGTGAPWAGETLDSVTFSTDKLTIPVTGIYLVVAYFNIGSFPSSSAKIALRFRTSGSAYTARKPTIKSSGVGAEGQLVASGLISFTVNDYLQVYLASDSTGNLLIKDANVSIHRVG